MPSGLASLASRRLISVSGPDAAKYLQGVITANLFAGHSSAEQTLRQDQGFYAAFLTAQGRVLHDVFVYRDTVNLSGAADPDPSSAFLIEVDADDAERLQRHIKRYKLRAKFDVRLLDPVHEAAVWHAWSDNGTAAAAAAPGPGLIILRDTRAPALGYRILTRGGGGVGGEPPPSPLDRVSEEAYRLRRYLNGVAEGQAELLREQALPLESNLDLAGAIDFRKGCYVGQELTIRTRHRGVVRKRVLPCVLYGPAQAAPGGLAYRPAVQGSGGWDETGPEQAGLRADTVPAATSIGRVGKKGRSAGKWLRGMGNVGLALCRLEIMTDVMLPGEAAAAGGYREGDEFVMMVGDASEAEGLGREVKIKAFVPEWMRRGLSEHGQVQGH